MESELLSLELTNSSQLNILMECNLSFSIYVQFAGPRFSTNWHVHSLRIPLARI